jgi:hypothetical protein
MDVSTEPGQKTEERIRAREGVWASPVKRLTSSQIKAAINLNVDGKQLAGPLRGFGQLWQKTYSIRLEGAQITPEEVIKAWKDNFGAFWHEKNHFYGSEGAITPGEVAVLNLAGPYGITAPGGRGMLSTGVLVMYVDEVSFSFLTPEGHIFAGMITFSSHDDDGTTIAQIQALIRANDPLYEIGARIGMIHKMEDEHWHYVLNNLAGHFGVNGKVNQVNQLVDSNMQWRQLGNLRHNAAIHTGIFLALSPLRWAAGYFRRKR